MIQYIALLGAAGCLAALEMPRLLRRGEYREAVAVAVILLAGTTVSALFMADVGLPTVSQLLQWLIDPLVPLG